MILETINDFRRWCRHAFVDPGDVKVTIEFANRDLKNRAADALRKETDQMMTPWVIKSAHEFETGVHIIMGVRFNLTVAKCPTCAREQ